MPNMNLPTQKLRTPPARPRRRIPALFLALFGLLPTLLVAAETGEIPMPAATDIPAQCDKAIADFQHTAQQIETLPLAQASVTKVLLPWNRQSGQLGYFWGVGSLLSNVHPDETVRKAWEACDLKLSAAMTALLQRAALYQRFKAVKGADEIDRETLRSILDEFEDRGVNLPPARRAEALRMFDRLDKLQQDFARNIRENQTRLAFSAEELKGVPEAALEQYKRNTEGKLLVGFDYPEYLPVMEFAENEAVRQQLQLAYTRRGTPANLAILQEVTQLRKQLAGLLGYPSYAAFATRTRMVGKPKVVHDFLAKVRATVAAVEKRELAVLATEKARFTGKADTPLARWDLAFYEQRVRRSRYQLDPHEVRTQFPATPTLNWMLAVSEALYGLRFQPNERLPLWHPDARGYDVFDAASNAYLSSFYLDLYPREGKYKHAAAFGVRQVSTLEGSTPIAVLVTNFSRDGFDLEELETLFHEFGHILHGVLSKTRYSLNAGTNTRRDFVEAPSQMFELWARHPDSLALWPKVCPDCQPINPQLVARMNAARQFGQGTKYARQWLYAAYDMALAGPLPQHPLKLWQQMEGATPLGHVPGSEFPGTFGHIVGGYAAGYYGYMWSEVLALDMRSAFAGNLMNPAVGLRFRQTILENGSQMPEMSLVRRFLGREPSPEAFFREIVGENPVGQNPVGQPLSGPTPPAPPRPPETR